MGWRQKPQVKEDRGHFGLAWSVLAGYAIAVVVLLYGWHPRTRGMIDFRFGAIIVFMVVGAIGVIGASASAFRSWPHNPRARDVQKYANVKALYLDGLNLQQKWDERTVFYHVLQDSGPMQPAEYEKRDEEFEERAQRIIEWRDRADQSVVNWFGEVACRTFVSI